MPIAAFFDLDGTLLPGPSLEQRYLRYLEWHGDLRWRNWLRAALHLLPLAVRANWTWETRDAGEGEWAVLAANNKAYLRGVSCWTLRAFCAWMARYPVALLPAARRRIEWHAEQGHKIFLVTGTPTPLAEAIARELPGAVEILATHLEADGGCFTGRITGKAMAGMEKSRAVARLAAQQRMALSECFAYGDSLADRWLLSRVGHPVAVNPSRRLERLARRRGWPIARWTVPQATAPAPARLLPDDHRFIERLRMAAGRRGCRVTLLAQKDAAAAAEDTQPLENGAPKSAAC
jgi:HAD superfamily hydrolase (TIGR01490 family)